MTEKPKHQILPRGEHGHFLPKEKRVPVEIHHWHNVGWTNLEAFLLAVLSAIGGIVYGIWLYAHEIVK